jgi:non-ribosomal peptide synthase protein (TIGR01720 family)
MFSSGAALKELPYWRSVLADPPPPPSARRPGCYRDTAVARSHRTHERSVPLFGHAHRVYATNTAELLLCALARALAGWCGHRRTGVLLEGHGREAGFDDVDVSRTIGWFTCAYPIVLDLSDSDDIGRQIKLIKETVRAVPRGGVGYGVLKYLTGEPLTQGANLDWQPSISFNYLGQLERDVAGAGFARIDSDLGDSFDPGATREHALDIIGAIEDGCLQLTFAYAPECFDATRIELLVAGFDSALDAIIEHTTSLTETDLTPSDVDYEGFDIDGLDHFMDQLVQGR